MAVSPVRRRSQRHSGATGTERKGSTRPNRKKNGHHGSPGTVDGARQHLGRRYIQHESASESVDPEEPGLMHLKSVKCLI